MMADEGSLMTRSIFDPSGDETQHTGSRFSPQEAKQTSKMPPNLVDGKVEDQEQSVDHPAPDEPGTAEADPDK
jgi:hypothetical protein